MVGVGLLAVDLLLATAKNATAATTKAPLIAKVQSIINLQATYSLAVVHARRSQLIPLFPCLALSEIKRKQLIICLQLRHSGGRLTRPFSSDLASLGTFLKTPANFAHVEGGCGIP